MRSPGGRILTGLAARALQLPRVPHRTSSGSTSKASGWRSWRLPRWINTADAVRMHTTLVLDGLQRVDPNGDHLAGAVHVDNRRSKRLLERNGWRHTASWDADHELWAGSALTSPLAEARDVRSSTRDPRGSNGGVNRGSNARLSVEKDPRSSWSAACRDERRVGFRCGSIPGIDDCDARPLSASLAYLPRSRTISPR